MHIKEEQHLLGYYYDEVLEICSKQNIQVSLIKADLPHYYKYYSISRCRVLRQRVIDKGLVELVIAPEVTGKEV